MEHNNYAKKFGSFEDFDRLVEKEKLQGFRKRLTEIISNFTEIKYLGLNPREFKLRKKELIKEMQAKRS